MHQVFAHTVAVAVQGVLEKRNKYHDQNIYLSFRCHNYFCDRKRGKEDLQRDPCANKTTTAN